MELLHTNHGERFKLSNLQFIRGNLLEFSLYFHTSQNHKMVEVHLFQCLCSSRKTWQMLLRTKSRQTLNISKKGDSILPLGSLPSVTLNVQKFFPHVQIEPPMLVCAPCFLSCHWALQKKHSPSLHSPFRYIYIQT